MSILNPLMPAHFLHWAEEADASGDEVFRLVSWRRSLTLKGKSFRDFEAQVIPLLTGQFSVDEICAKVAHVFRKEDVVASLDLLAKQGFVVAGEKRRAPMTDAALSPQMGWLSEAAPDSETAQQKLADAHVVLFGAGSQGAVCARSLVAARIGRLTIADPTDVAPTDLYFSGLFRSEDIGTNRAEALCAALSFGETLTSLKSKAARPENAATLSTLIEDATLVLCCLESGESRLTQMLNIACRTASIPWIAASLEGTELVVGPGFTQASDGPCYMCWRQREIAAATNPFARYALEAQLDQLQTDLSSRRENLSASADIVGGLLSAEVLSWLTDVCPPNLDGRFLTVEVPGLKIEKHTVLRKPGCPVCGVQT